MVPAAASGDFAGASGGAPAAPPEAAAGCAPGWGMLATPSMVLLSAGTAGLAGVAAGAGATPLGAKPSIVLFLTSADGLAAGAAAA